MSDIHGDLRAFQSVLRQIDLHSDDTLYVLGDVIDRRPHGIRILQQLMSMPNVRMLPGNHEYMMLDAMDEPFDEKDDVEYYLHLKKTILWHRNGGKVTQDSLKHMRKKNRAKLFAYLRALPVQKDIEIGGVRYRLTHSGDLSCYAEHADEYSDEKEFAVWYRRTEEDVPRDDCVVIFGHTPTFFYQDAQPPRIWHGERQICIDCGSGYPQSTDPEELQFVGRLACLRLEDMKEFYAQE